MTQRPRILVVDDEESMRNFVACALDAAGYEVVGASNGPHALECVERHPPFDLLIVDMLMPQMEGHKPVSVDGLLEGVALLLNGRLAR